ncbi:MAG: DUF6448 family protein [Thermodesulfobacteriota bacterium]
MTKTQQRMGTWLFLVLLAGAGLQPATGFTHCDTLDGPVVATARTALDKGDITPLLKWVQADNEEEIREAFQKTLAVRATGDQARELADRYFFETLVRIHRAGEGAPYTGLKPGTAVDPAVALADQALATGNVDQLVDTLTGALAAGIRQRFQRTREAHRHAGDSVAAGRAFVEAYVVFTHYVEGLHGLIAGAAAHHDAGGPATEHGQAEEAAGGHAH